MLAQNLDISAAPPFAARHILQGLMLKAQQTMAIFLILVGLVQHLADLLYNHLVALLGLLFQCLVALIAC